MVRLSVVLVLTACLGGCGVLGSAPVAKDSLEQMVASTPPDAARAPSVAPTRSAMAMLPLDAGRIQTISARVFADGAQQSITYDHAVAGLKTNEVSITVMSPRSTATLDTPAAGRAPREKPSEAAIRAVLASDFPRMQMRIVSSPRSNDFGVYGLAAGQWANGVRCIYAWQWIEPLKPSHDGTVASVRIRLCRSDLTLDQLAAFVDQLKIDPARREIDVPAAIAEPNTSPPLRKPQAAAAKPAAKPPALRRLATHAPAPLLPLQAPVAFAGTSAEPDPSLPAAAYRGPSTNLRTASQ